MVIGFRYRRSSGVGTSNSTGGILSSVNGIFGSVMIERCRKSSGMIGGPVKLDSDRADERAAILIARIDAVIFDLNPLFGINSISDVSLQVSANEEIEAASEDLKGKSSTSGSGLDRGWFRSSAAIEAKDSQLRVGIDLRPLKLGVASEDRNEGEVSPGDAGSNEGMDSDDMVLDERMDSRPASLCIVSSSRSSSGGLSSISI